METIIKKKRNLFYISYFLYVVATLLQSTMFTQYNSLSKCFVLMRYMAFAVGAVKIVIDLFQQWQNDVNEKTDKNIISYFRIKVVQQILVYIVISIVLLLVSLKTDDRTLIFVFVIILAAKDNVMDVIVKRTLMLQFIVMAIVLVSSSVGIIPDLLFKRDQIPIRHALGYTYPSVMVTSCFFLLLLYLWNKNKPINWKEFLVIESVNFLIYRLTDSKTGFLLIALVAFIIWGIGLLGGERQHQKIGRIKGRWEGIKGVIYDFFPVWLSLGLLFLCLTLPWNVTQWVNQFLTNRIQMIVNAVQNYGIHSLGNHIEWIGFGGSTDTDSLLANYNFVDSSYGYILINYGWIVFVFVLVAFVWCCHKVRKNESSIRQFIFLMVLVYCFIEPRLLELQVNTFLLLLSPLLTNITFGKYLTGKRRKEKS